MKISQAFHDPSINFDLLPSRVGKVHTFKTPEMRLYFDSDEEADVLQLFLWDLFIILSFLPKLTVMRDESSRPKIGQ